LRFSILGPMEVTHHDEVCTPSAQKVRWTLALLLLRANHVVDRSVLIDELWGDNPPRSAVTTMQTYIYQLRRMFGGTDPQRDVDKMIVTRAPGYGIWLQPGDQLDVIEFESAAKRGRELVAARRYAEASGELNQALALWRGVPLADIARGGRLLGAHMVHLEEIRLRTLELRIAAETRLGNSQDLIPELRQLVQAHPLNEWFHGELIRALARSGRRGEAFDAYHALRRILREELGLEPSVQSQRLHHQLLTDKSSAFLSTAASS